jgi:hypothetical protein
MMVDKQDLSACPPSSGRVLDPWRFRGVSGWFVKFRGVCVVVFADGSCDVVGDLSPSLSLKSADGPATCMVVSAEMLVGLGRDLGW